MKPAFVFLTLLVFVILIIVFIGNMKNEKAISQNLPIILFTTKSTVNQSFNNFICDYTDVNRFPLSSSTSPNLSFDIYRKTFLEKYCKIVAIPQSNWSSATTYKEQDVAFVIFTAASFYHTRATAVRDTWLSRITNYYFLSSVPYPYLPITVVPNAGEDKLSNMKKLFYGLQLIYQQQMNLSVDQRQKWFYIIGCDTFVLPHHLLKRLEGMDYMKPLLIGGHSDHHGCLGSIKEKKTVEFPSGGAGFFFSIKLLDMMQPHLTNYVENIWPKTSEISDVALACLAADLGITITRKAGFWSHPPEITLKDEGLSKFHQDVEPNNFHYIQPDEMYALDEFYVNQHLDRLVKGQNWNEYIAFTRRFVSSHYELLRKKRQECTLPKI